MPSNTTSLRDATLQAVTPDMLAMMAYLRDIPLSSIGVHVAGRPDITGARLQAGIRFLFNRANVTVQPVAVAPLEPAKPVKASRAKTTEPGTVAAFLAALQRVARAGDTRCSVPILATVKLSIRNGHCTLQCTDMERVITESFLMPGALDMDACIPFKPLVAALKAMPGHCMPTLEVLAPATSHKDDAGTFKLGASAFPRQAVADFPTFEIGSLKAPFTHGFEITAESLCAALSTVQHAISNEETRYYLNGVSMRANAHDNTIVFVSTDGHRMAKVEQPLPDGAEGMPDALIHKLAVADILALLSKATGPVQVAVSETRVQFTHGQTVIMSKLIDGAFPEYERVIPRDNDVTATLDKASLTAAIKACMALADRQNQSLDMKFSMERGALNLSASTIKNGATSQAVTCLKPTPVNFEAGYQGRYLLATLAAMKGNPVFKWSSDHVAGAPVLILDDANPEALFVMMPVRV
jgi:DNA polymerase-3 subunit beta